MMDINKNITLKNIKCPSCGANVTVEENYADCIYCGNSLILNTDSEYIEKNEESPRLGSLSSIRAFVEHYYEDYDWYSFSQSSSLNISKIDSIIKDLKNSHADNFVTWEIAYYSLSLKIHKKIEHLKKLKKEIIEQYKVDKTEALGNYSFLYSVFSKILSEKNSLLNELKDYLKKALKYGSDKNKINIQLEEINQLEKNIDSFDLKKSLMDYDEVNLIEKNNEIEYIQQMKANNISVEEQYNEALQLITSNNFIEALRLLEEIIDYRDVHELISNCNNFFSMSHIIKHQDRLFFYDKQYQDYSLSEIKNNLIESKVTLVFLEILANYGNYIYFLSKEGQIIKFDSFSEQLSTITKVKDLKYFSRSKNKLYFTKNENSNIYSEDRNEIKKIFLLDLSEDKFMKLDHLSTKNMFSTSFKLVGFTKSNMVFTRENPTKMNVDLFKKNIEQDEEEKLIEANIYKVINIIGGRIYYIIGSEKHQSLICSKLDGSERFELPLMVKNVLFERFGWLYFLVGDSYNTALYKSRLDGSSIKRIIIGIDKFVKFDEEYIYYINNNKLYKVQQNGYNNELVHLNVENVLYIKDNKIFLTAKDDYNIISLYELNINNNKGPSKIAYNIIDSKLSKENEIYYLKVVEKNTKQLFKYNIKSQTNILITDLKSSLPKTEGCYIATSVYGSYECPEVWTLRRYRDSILYKSILGRLFIKIYYKISPLLVKRFGNSKNLKLMVKKILNKKVKKLRQKGIVDSPYVD